MRARLALLAALGCVVAAGCSKREHSNPFDPENPQTHGRPIGFAALAGNQSVTLQWQPVSGPGVLGFQVFRRSAPESSFVPISDHLAPSTDHLNDFGLINGVEHFYRLYYVLANGLAGAPAEDAATPGPLRPWVTEFSGNALLRLTPDNRHVAFADRGFTGPAAVAVDPSTGAVWTCDTFGDRVVLYVPGIPFPRVIQGVSSPVAVAVDASNHTGWVCDQGSNQVLQFTVTGAVPQRIQNVVDPVAVAIDPNDGSLWVCEGRGRKVRGFDSNGSPLWGPDVDRPSRVAVDSLTRAGWVTSFSNGHVVRITSAGAPFDTLGGFSGPIGIAIDSQRGRVWVADALADQVVALRRDGSVEFRIRNLGEVREVAVDPATGEAWATLPGAGQVARLSSVGDGTVVRRLGGLVEPYAIAIDPGVR